MYVTPKNVITRTSMHLEAIGMFLLIRYKRNVRSTVSIAMRKIQTTHAVSSSLLPQEGHNTAVLRAPRKRT